LFQDETRCITFAIFYLWDVALEWFEPGLSGQTEEPPTWLEDWDAFVKELQTNFGPYNESGDIESELVNLRMKDSQCISEYMVWFNSLAFRCSWGKSTLRHRFYGGLPSHLKDDVSRGEGKPKDLLSIRRKAQNSDTHYWEHVQEHSQEGNTNPKTTPSKTPNQSSSNSGNNSNQQQKGQFDAKSSCLAVLEKTLSTTKPDLSGKLDSHGKLTAKECQYQIDNNLCLFCGKKGHWVTDCLSEKASTAKGRAAVTTSTDSVFTDLISNSC